MSLTDFRTLGRSGLAVSPLALGTMTFGAQGWGSGEDGSRAVFDAYVEAGGNFIDTADLYAKGNSEEMLGGFIAERSLRHRLVLATKSGFNREPGNPQAGGNGAKAIHDRVETSLRRLRTDHIDLYWQHVWDMVTPAEEVLETMGNLVRSGKIRYFGLSNVPVWYLAKMATLASAYRVPGPIALQLEYSLTERNIEREYLPAAREFGLGVLPWSPLSGGFLSGKYHREDTAADPREKEGVDGRLSKPNPFGETKFTERNWIILDVLRAVADDVGRPPAQVALAWACARPGITAPILGASRVDQLHDNIAALEIKLSAEQKARLDEAGAPEPAYPSRIFSPEVNAMVFGGTSVTGWATQRG
ncbi:aldo/keto reductase [Sphingomonas sp. BAUL-RG-20F-R05-02]|uniref:aldo/keto reductase n=1 Tax=Sphingomonas sp. BAUL-RG-20F-R05-02 TaxID=2914830 RepID=UPI001F568710|nr:aldo/keto reductase [Sphingomonas sp. BAUL-RG-20F-R05-02]